MGGTGEGQFRPALEVFAFFDHLAAIDHFGVLREQAELSKGSGW